MKIIELDCMKASNILRSLAKFFNAKENYNTKSAKGVANNCSGDYFALLARKVGLATSPFAR